MNGQSLLLIMSSNVMENTMLLVMGYVLQHCL